MNPNERRRQENRPLVSQILTLKRRVRAGTILLVRLHQDLLPVSLINYEEITKNDLDTCPNIFYS